MQWQWAVVGDQNRKKPIGIVVHAVGKAPQWLGTSKQSEVVLKALFLRDRVYGNVPDGAGGYKRIVRGFSDEDYLDFAAVKVNLPVYVVKRGVWKTDVDDAQVVIGRLRDLFMGESK